MGIRVWKCVCILTALLWSGVGELDAKTVYVAPGGDLQAALDAAEPGDVILLAEGAEFVGNYVLPVKTGERVITLQTSAPLTLLPPRGQRITPAHAPLLPKLRSPNGMAALQTAPGTRGWMLRYLEFLPNEQGFGDILQIGDGSSAQNTLARVPRQITLEHLYVHGDPFLGQKRCIALNAAQVRIADSHVSDCKGVAQDTQAIGGWNGPGPYVIENNYLEGAGENLLLGGADPAIPNLVADGVTFRRNYVSRPMSWRDPILGSPQRLQGTAESSGALPAGTYAYRVVARGTVGMGRTVRSTASMEVSVTLAAPGAVRVRWGAVPGASEYRVYGRTAGAQSMSWTVGGTEFVDTGEAGPSDSVPRTAGTVWTVKNLFELKNARNVVVEENIFENHWREAQPGYAIVLTPRNSGGACTWCVVEHVRFRYNIVRNVAAGVNLLGEDDAATPTKLTNNVVVSHNLFTGVTTALGGNGWFMQVGGGPRDLVIEHNTIDATGGSVMYTYGGTSTNPKVVYGLRMNANAARHGAYGFNGANFAYGNAVLAGYYPDAVFEANYLAGGSASRYPAGTLVSGSFADQFVNLAAGDFALRSDSLLRGRAPGGGNIGVDYPDLAERVQGVQAGVPPGGRAIVPPTAAFTATCVDLRCTFTCASTDADGVIASRTWTFGDGTVATGGIVSRTYAAPGADTVTLEVADNDGATAAATDSIGIVALLHVGNLDASTRSWVRSDTNYWSAAVRITVHGADERPIANARVDVAWSGAVTKTASCTTGSTGVCTLDSGTLSWKRDTVTVTVTGVSAAESAYTAANHDPDGSSTGTVVTARRP